MLLLISFPLLNRLAVENSFSSEYQKGESNMAIDNDWQMERHDPQMTGHTNLKGKITRPPEIVWKHYLGLWCNYLSITAKPDFNQEIKLPDEAFGEGYINKNSLDWRLRRPPIDIDGKGTFYDVPEQSSIKFAKLLPGVSGYQKVEFDNAFAIGANANYGRMYSYEDGVDKPKLIWQTERIKDMYAPVVAIEDVDLDGQKEIILLTHYHLAIYDSIAGKIKDSVQWNVGRNYGQLDVIDVDMDGRPDFVIQADSPPHLEYINNSHEGAKLIWSHKYLKDEADVAVPTDFHLNNLPNAVRDLDGDGRIELAVNIRHFKDDKRWHVVIFDALTGDVKVDIIDRYLWAVADIDHDGFFELFLSSALTRTVECNSTLYALTFNGTELIQKWVSKEKGSFCMKNYFFPDNANSASSRGPVHHSTLITSDVDNDGFDEFFVTTCNRLLTIGLDGASSQMKVKSIVTSPSELPPKAIAEKPDKVLLEVNAESGIIKISGAKAELLSHYMKKGFCSTPSIADIDGDGYHEIVVENSAGFIEVLNLKANKVPLWKFRAYAQPVWVTWKIRHAPVPIIDLDGDGKKEIICCDSSDESCTTIYALKYDGSIYWKSEIKDIGPRLTETIKVGKFRPDGWDVIITILPTTQPEMLCLDGRTGNIRWHKKSWIDDNGRAWPYPNRYIFYDNDNDGFHEIYGSYAYIFYVLDGNKGEPIRKPINIWHDVFHRWQSYFFPIPKDYNGDGKIEFFLASEASSIGGVTVVTPEFEILWEKHLTNSTGASGLQGIGDCNGDGIPEIAFYHIDGRIVCYHGKSGDILWQIENLGNSSGGHFTSGDINSDGKDEFLFSLASNEIIALSHDVTGHILWRKRLGATPDTPILADIDGDGLTEIIVCTSDGYINVLK